MSTRLHIVVPDEFVARIDAALGPGQPRADYIRRAVERSLARDDGSAWREAERDVAERYGLEPPAVEQALGGEQATRPENGCEAPNTQAASLSPAPAEQPRVRANTHGPTCKCLVCS